MNKQDSTPVQLCFSIGRPLAVLVEEVQTTSQNPELRTAAAQMREALQTFTVANQNGKLMSAQIREAVYELLTK